MLREALAKYCEIPAENLLAAAGSDELIDLLMRLTLEPGDRILICPPTFGMYAFDAGLNAAEVVEIPRRRDFSLDPQAIEQGVRAERPKLIFLASPNNPDGALVSRQVLESLLDLPAIIVLDEAYIEFAPAGSSWLGQVPARRNLVVLRTFSKWAGLAGLRVGYGAFPASLMDHLWKIKQPYNLSVAGSTAARVSLEHLDELQAIASKLVAERGTMYTGLKAVSYLSPYPSQSNFILCRVLGRAADELKTALADRGILIRYFDTPELRDHIRITVGKPEHTQAVMTALAELE